MKQKILFFCIITGILGASCKKDSSEEDRSNPNSGTVKLSFVHSVKDQPLVFGTNYVTDPGETYSVNRFRYYVHDINLVNHQGSIVNLSQDYFLVDHEDNTSRQITLTVPADKYTGLVFLLGVDSTRNVSGAQTGALDPAKGMFWTWASGYIMAKLEGHSPASTISGQVFTYHVGGFKSPYVTMRQIRLPMLENMIVAKDTTITMTLNADINTWFSRIHPILISNNAACHSPGKLANDLADNYEGMFSIKSVE